MKKPETIDELIGLAAEFSPDTSAAELGFETRLLAQLREIRDSGNGSFVEIFADWSWRSAFGLTPLVAIAATVFFVAHGISLSLPAGTEDFVGYVSGMLPSNLFQ